MLKDRYTINEVAVMTGLTTRTIRNYLRDGQASASKTEDGKWVFSLEECQAMFSNPYVAAAIKAKNSAPVLDFLGDERKKADSLCLILDRRLSDEAALELSERVCAAMRGMSGVDFRFEKKGDRVRVILTGEEEKVRGVFMTL